MALCSLDHLKALVSSGDWTYASEHCKRKVRAYDLTDDDVETIILSLNPERCDRGGNFRSEYGPAQTGDFGVLQADDYLIWYQGLLLYLKLAIFTDADDDLCVVVRLHPST
jgi:hypothetical protein